MEVNWITWLSLEWVKNPPYSKYNNYIQKKHHEYLWEYPEDIIWC